MTQTKSEEVHKFEELYIPIQSENLSLYISHLTSTVRHLSTLIQEIESKSKSLIRHIQQEASIHRSKIDSMQMSLISRLSQVFQSKRVAKNSLSRIDQLLIQDPTSLSDYLSSLVLPQVKFSLPQEKLFTLVNEDLEYTSDSLLFSSIVSRLNSINNKIMLNELSKYLNDKESQKVLLSIMYLSQNQPEYQSLASKAFTILSKHHFNFSNLSLQKLNLSNSEVTGGKFIGTNFSGSDFSQVKMNFSVLLPAVFDFFTLKTMNDGSRFYKGHKDLIQCVKFSKDSRILVSGSLDKTICVWEVKTGHCLNVLEGHVDGVMCVDIADDNSEIVSGARDGIVKIWELITGMTIANLTLDHGQNRGAVRSIAFTSNKMFIVAGNLDQQVIVWNKGGIPIALFDLESDIWCVKTPKYSDNEGNFEIWAGCRSGDLALMKTNSKKILWRQKEAHKQWISCILVSRKGNSIITTGCDGFIRVWKRVKQVKLFNLQLGFTRSRELKVFDSSIYSAKAFAEGQFIFLICENVVQIIQKKKLLMIFTSKLNFSSFVTDASDFGTYFAMAQENNIRTYMFPEIFSHI
jgi:WD40 repeat protein